MTAIKSEKELKDKLYTIIFEKPGNESDNTTKYQKQQDAYNELATDYDDMMKIVKWKGPSKAVEIITNIYKVNRENLDVLDFGCGTGLVADLLTNVGITYIDGVDCNQKSLDVAKEKQRMKNYYCGKDTEALISLPSASYDVICSVGTFFVQPTYPGTNCYKEIVRLIKPGGYFIIVSKTDYLDKNFRDDSIVRELENEGKIKVFPKEIFDGYRQAFADTEITTGAVLKYQVLK